MSVFLCCNWPRCIHHNLFYFIFKFQLMQKSLLKMWPTWQSSEKTETVDLWTTSQLCHGVLILCRAQAKLRPWWLSESCSESSSASFSRLMTLTCFTLANVTQHLCKGQKCQLYFFYFLNYLFCFGDVDKIGEAGVTSTCRNCKVDSSTFRLSSPKLQLVVHKAVVEMNPWHEEHCGKVADYYLFI